MHSFTFDWDDGNTSDNDGCSSTWHEEVGKSWYGGSRTTQDTWETCGDGALLHPDSTSCDDWNTISGDGCNEHCHKEYGWTCSRSPSTSPDIWTENWGDGIRFNSNATYWDDKNNTPGDGWDAGWTIETGWTCAGGTSSTKDIWTDIWADGKKYTTATYFWDDGNTTPGDGWNNKWVIEDGWIWTGGNPTTTDTWKGIWGDGRRYTGDSTAWDDGNTSNDDGCSSSWSVETGWTWTGGNTTKADTCTEIWGDGVRFNTNATYWDDGNITSGDGWSSSWVIEIGWNWSGGNSTNKDLWLDIWGDGKKYTSNTTFWDDGGKTSNDGWSSSWYVESGWRWSGGTTTTADTWTEIWSDGKRFNSNSTYCDDSNTVNGDGWSSSWSIETGWKWSGGSTTTADSWVEIWGDGIRFNTNSTYCDDGNKENGDGWDSLWVTEKNYECSGGNSKEKDDWKEVISKGIQSFIFKLNIFINKSIQKISICY